MFRRGSGRTHRGARKADKNDARAKSRCTGQSTNVQCSAVLRPAGKSRPTATHRVRRPIDRSPSVRFHGRVIGTILTACAALRRWKTLIRVVCVVAVAMASVSHVVADFTAANASPLAMLTVVSEDTDGPRDATTAVERCHYCSVVPFLTVADVGRQHVVTGSIPEGRLLHLFSFRQPITAPPPRALI